MLLDSIKHGETLRIHATAQDTSGTELIDDTWSATCRVSHGDGTPLVDVAMTITGNTASGSADTGEAPWAPGRYFYDIRLTDPDGDEHVSDPVVLTVTRTSTPQIS